MTSKAKVLLLSPLMLVTGSCGGGGDQSGPPLVTLPTPTPTPAPAPAPTPTPAARYVLEPDIRYGDGQTSAGSIPLFLDLYRPDSPCTVARPTVVRVHGGGFQTGSRKDGGTVSIAEALVPLGVNVISIQYRLQGDNPVISTEFAAFESDHRALVTNAPAERARAFTAAVEDTVRALRWVQANAGRYCIDADRIGLWGSSAGAYTVLHVGYSLDGYNIPHPAPRVVVDYWGGLFRDADLEAGEAPLFVLHGTADPTVAYTEAVEITQRATATGVPFTFYSVTGGGHGFEDSGFGSILVDGQSIADKTAQFVAAHLFDGRTAVYERRDLQR